MAYPCWVWGIVGIVCGTVPQRLVAQITAGRTVQVGAVLPTITHADPSIGVDPTDAGRRVARPLTFEDALSTRSIDGLRISANGIWVAYSISEERRRYLHAGKMAVYFPTGVPHTVNGARVCIANTATREQRCIGDPNSSSWGPSFSPDGSHLAFYSDASGKARLWTYDLTTRRAQVLSREQVRVFMPFEVAAWSADGKKIYTKFMPLDPLPDLDPLRPSTEADLVRVYRSPNDAPRSSEKSVGAPEDPNNWAYTADLAEVDVTTGRLKRLIRNTAVRGWWVSADGGHLAYSASTAINKLDEAAELYTLGVIDLRSGASHVVGANLPLEALGQAISWSPTGDRLAFATAHASDSAGIDCFIVPDAGMGTVTSIAAVVRPTRLDWNSRPVWDSSGAFLVLHNAERLFIYDIARATERSVAPRSGAAFVQVLASQNRRLWADQKHTLYAVERDLASKDIEFVRVDLDRGDLQVVTRQPNALDRYGFEIDAGESDRVLAYVLQAADTPPDVFVSTAGFGHTERLTHVNPQLDTYRFGKSTVISWRNIDGMELHGAVLLPQPYEPDKRYPLIVNVYGGSNLSETANEFGLDDATGPTNAQVFATRGYAVLEPDAPMAGDTPTPMLDLLKDVMPGVDKAIEMGIADPDHMAIMGGSYGGYSTVAILTQTSRFKAAATLSGPSDLMQTYGSMRPDGAADMVGWAEDSQGRMGATPWQRRDKYIENSPLWYADRIHTPLLIACGDIDPSVVDARGCRALFVALRRLGRPAEYREYVGGGHLPSHWNFEQQKDFLPALLSWFDEHLNRANGANAALPMAP